MPIQIQAPDGSIAQFPDGMADADIEKVMAQHYPQPSLLDRAIASPPGRLLHDIGGGIVKGVTAGPDNMARMLNVALPADYRLPVIADAIDRPYEGALARNRNTPGYAAERAQADKAASQAAGFTSQMTAGFNPTIAGAVTLPWGLDASNANADAVTAQQNQYAAEHPVKSFTAGVLGSLLTPPENAISNALKPQPIIPNSPPIKPQAADANAAGYKLPPRMITDKPGIIADIGSGIGGKTKLAQDASAANQEVTNRLAAQSLGLPPDTMLTDKVLANVRKTAGKAYAAIPQAIPSVGTDQQFISDIQALGTKNTAAGAEFPDLMGNDQIDKLVDNLAGTNAKSSFKTDAAMDLVRQLRKNANTNFRSMDDPAKLDLAFAQRGAADAVDNLIERNLQAYGSPDMAQAYRQARIQIAKAHDLEAATNTVTGNVSARKIANLSARGKPLTGPLATIADTAAAFPKAMQSEAAFGEVEPISVLDVAAGTAALPHNPSLLGAVLGRPLARKIMLSDAVQNGLVNRASQPASAALLGTPQLRQQLSLPAFAAMSLPRISAVPANR